MSVLSLFGEPVKFYSAKSTLGRENDYVATLMQYGDFVVRPKPADPAGKHRKALNEFKYRFNFRVVNCKES